MATAKLVFDLREGRLEVEGDQSFVQQIYTDFKAELAKSASEKRVPDFAEQKGAETARQPKKARSSARKIKATSSNGEDSSPNVSTYKPSLDKTLDLAKLRTFIEPYQPKNAAEKILLYAQFLKEELSIEPCSVDAIYSCFSHLKEKVPTAFGQVLINTRGDAYGYIDFTNTKDITVSTRGMNHYNFDIAKKDGAK